LTQEFKTGKDFGKMMVKQVKTLVKWW